MSMLIIGVNPPKSCYACSWYNKVECPVNDGRYYYRVQRHPSCPLIELPPHGRLIDADAVNKAMDERIEKLKDDKSIYEASCVATALDMFAPTVIEAEGEKE